MSRHDAADRPAPVAALDRSDAGVLVLDPAGEVVGADDRAAGLLDRPVGELRNSDPADLLTGVEADLDALPGGTAAETTVRCRVAGPTGESRALSLRTVPLHGTDARTVALLRPVDAPTATEPPVDFRAIAETSFDLIFRVDTEGELTYLSEAARALLGDEPGELLGRHFGEFIHEGDLSAAWTAFDRALEGESTLGLELRLRTAADRLRHAEVNLTPVREGDRVVGAAGTARDVTEREARLRSLERLERVNETIRSVDRALVEREGRSATIRAVCERLADAEPYSLAWFGEPTDGVVEAVAAAGEGEDYLADRRLDPADPVEAGLPACRAMETGEVVVAEGPAGAATDGEDAESPRGTAGVPVTHDGTRHGVLCLRAEDRAAFDGRERAVLSELGESVGRALSMAGTREGARLFRQLLDQSGDGVYVLDPGDGTIVDVNDTVVERLGYDRAALLGRPIFDVAEPVDGPHGDDVPSFEELAAAAAGTEIEMEGRHERADGTTIPVETRLTTASRPSGREYVVAIARDVTERERREERLREQSRILDAVVDGTPSILFAFEPDGTLTRSEGDALRNIGVEPGEHLGESVFDVYADSPGVVEACERALAGEPVQATHELGGRTLETWYSPLTDDDGTVERVVGLALDDTERRERIERLRTQERVLETVLENVPVVQFTLDADGVFEQSRGAALAELGLEPGEVVGTSAFDLYAGNEELLDGVRRALDGERVQQQVEAGGRVFRSWYIPLFEEDLEGTRGAGDAEPGEEGSADGAGGQVERVVGLAVDVTDRRRREEVVSVLDRVLRHNLRNDMNVILGAAQRVEAAAVDEPVAARAAERVRATARELLGLADTARELQEIVDPDRDRDYGQVDPVPIVEAACRRARAETPAATVRFEAADERPRVPDPGLQLAVRELLDNAVEHAGGQPTVRVAVDIEDGGTVRIRVSDDGPGLPEMERAVLTGNRETSLRHGQGLGLWLVYWVVQEAGGDVSVDVEDGTTVELRIPAARTTEPTD